MSVYVRLTVMIDLLLCARLAVTRRCVLTDILEVFGHLVHLVSFEVRDNDVNFVAAAIVHAAEEHELWELRGFRGLYARGRTDRHVPC